MLSQKLLLDGALTHSLAKTAIGGINAPLIPLALLLSTPWLVMSSSGRHLGALHPNNEASTGTRGRIDLHKRSAPRTKLLVRVGGQ
jgi:hypothetical protein